ncbi:MAG: aminoglycoside phosphotransferase family protein [Actinomycetota bacterium]|nr:aminoglycoside phosphotransferase family protein [Actinomycetota bacterium]
MKTRPPSDVAVLRTLQGGLRDLGDDAVVAAIERTPYPYATSFPLEEVVARLEDGRTLHLILKDLTWDRLLGQAATTKPRFLHEPRRCFDVHRRVLAGTGVGPTFYGAFVDGQRRRYWFLSEKVEGVELWQIGDLATWEAVARWLARFHTRFAGAVDDLARRSRHLLRYDRQLLSVWPARAREVSPDLDLARVVSRYGTVVERLAHVPPTLVHGELYPSNVLVHEGDDRVDVWPVDWELAGTGPALLDLAALTSGWQGPEQAQLVDAYRDELVRSGAPPGEDFDVVLDCCRMHYALQWLGWSSQWSPPPEHTRDWLSDAIELGERLAL